jgi:hypothetical protein
MLEGYGEANQVSEDPHALKLYIDGNVFNNPGGTGGFACFAEFPESWDRPDEEIFRQGFHETSNNRMELRACICALEYVRDQGSSLGVQRVQIVTTHAMSATIKSSRIIGGGMDGQRTRTVPSRTQTFGRNFSPSGL